MAVDDHGIESIRKSAEEVTPGDQSDYHLKVTTTNSGVAVKPSNTGLTTIKSDLTTAEFEITAVTSQKSIIVTNLDNVSVHFSISTGVTTSNAFIRRGDQLVLENYGGSVFVRRASGTGSIQIDQESLV